MIVDNTDVMVSHVSAKSKVLYVANKVRLRYEYLDLDWVTGEFKARWSFPAALVQHVGRHRLFP